MDRHGCWLLLIPFLLSGCTGAAPLTVAQARATAAVAGCWPGAGLTPLPVTVTPWGGVAITPDPLLPTPTVLPTTTPYPRCTPDPGEPTQIPYPTSAPTRVPYPTRAAFQSREGETAATVLEVAETILSVDLAAHPTENWPVVAAVAAPLITRDTPQAWVRVFDPHARRWRDAVSLGSGPSGLARTRFRTVKVAVAGDGGILVVWGAVTAPRLGLMASASNDYGVTWSAPQAIARGSYGALDLAVAPDGQAAVLAVSEESQQPILIRRDMTGQWLPPESIPVPAWYGSTGALEFVGAGLDARIVAVTSGGGATSPDNTLFLLSRSFAGGAWAIERRLVAGSDGRPADLLSGMRAMPLDTGRVLFSFAMAGRAWVLAMMADDSGGGWGPVEVIAFGQGQISPFAAAAYDAQSNRMVVFWTCCGDARFVSAESTHYTALRTRDGTWSASMLPLVSGAVAVSDTASAQAYGAGSIWLAWVEHVHSVRIRAIDLAQVTIVAGGRP